MCHKWLPLEFQRALICFFAARRGDMSHHWTTGLLFVQIVAKWRQEKLISTVPIGNTDCFGETMLPLQAGICGTVAAVDAT